MLKGYFEIALVEFDKQFGSKETRRAFLASLSRLEGSRCLVSAQTLVWMNQSMISNGPAAGGKYP